MKYHYTETELKTLLASLTIIVDSREQENSHVTAYLDKRKVPYITQKLDFGDYSCFLPANPELGIIRDAYFSDMVVVERKNSLTELSNNLSNDRDRFVSELLRAKPAYFHLMVENAPGGYADILNHRYDTQYNEKSYAATLKSFEAAYDLRVNFLPDNKLSGFFIWSTMYYFVRNHLLGR